MSLLKTLAGAVFPGAGCQADLAVIVTQNPGLMHATLGMLTRDSSIGGLPGLVARFQNAGLGDIVTTWLGSGPNTPVSAQDLQHALGGNVVDQLAAQAKMTPSEATGALAQTLPPIVDRLSPNGAAKLLDMAQIQSMLGDFLKGHV